MSDQYSANLTSEIDQLRSENIELLKEVCSAAKRNFGFQKEVERLELQLAEAREYADDLITKGGSINEVPAKPWEQPTPGEEGK